MRTIVLVAVILLTGCDPNARPTYGETGLPKNCRAIVQTNIDGWRAGRWSVEDVMDSLERNCGADGYSWGR